MNTVLSKIALSRLALVFIIAAGLLAAGCEPPAPPAGGAAAAPGGPPPPPGGAAATPAPAAAPGPAAAGGLPADLVQKIDALIQSHKDYSAIAAQVQDGQAVRLRRKDNRAEILRRIERVGEWREPRGTAYCVRSRDIPPPHLAVGGKR